MSFDRLARHYDWMEALLAGRKLQRCRTAFLEDVRRAECVLLAGEGHGRFLAEFCRVNSGSRIIYVDASGKMAERAKRRLVRSGFNPDRVQFQTTPLERFASSERFDLVVTHFFLDCFDKPELAGIVELLTAIMRPGGLWIISDFQLPAKSWRRIRAAAVLALAYRFFRLTTRLSASKLTAPGPLLAQQGLSLEKRREFNYQLLYAELWKKTRVS